MFRVFLLFPKCPDVSCLFSCLMRYLCNIYNCVACLYFNKKNPCRFLYLKKFLITCLTLRFLVPPSYRNFNWKKNCVSYFSFLLKIYFYAACLFLVRFQEKFKVKILKINNGVLKYWGPEFDFCSWPWIFIIITSVRKYIKLYSLVYIKVINFVST